MKVNSLIGKKPIKLLAPFFNITSKIIRAWLPPTQNMIENFLQLSRTFIHKPSRKLR